MPASAINGVNSLMQLRLVYLAGGGFTDFEGGSGNGDGWGDGWWGSERMGVEVTMEQDKTALAG